jgi:hypothetical protein
MKWAIATAVAVALSFAAEAIAGDGVLEINQACVAAGCFPGDGPGFPVQCNESGSYRLTSSLTVPDGNTTAVDLDSYATLDLGGFAIIGTTVCTGDLTVTCTGGSGSSNGVAGGDGVTIRNGTIRNMGTAGISAGDGTLVENMLIQENRSRGIVGSYGGRGWIIRNSRIVRNGTYGIDFAVSGAYSLITNNVIEGNELAGVYALGALLLDNAIANNGREGIGGNFAGQKKAYARNTINYNNGGNDQDQTEGAVQIGVNVCASDTTCP